MAVGYFLGRKPYYHHLNEYVRLWRRPWRIPAFTSDDLRWPVGFTAARRFPRLHTPEEKALILQGVAVPRSTRPPTLENVVPWSTSLEPPHAELVINAAPDQAALEVNIAAPTSFPTRADVKKSAAPLEPPTADYCAAPTRLEPPTADSWMAPMSLEPPTADTRAAPTRLEPPTAEAAHLQPPTMGVGAYRGLASLPSTCPNVDVPTAAALNSSAASSPRPLVAPRVPMLSPSPSPFLGSPADGITPRLFRKYQFSHRGFGPRHHSNPRHRWCFIRSRRLHGPQCHRCRRSRLLWRQIRRKFLSENVVFCEPTIQNGEIVVRPSIDVVREDHAVDNTAVGYFLGRKPYYHHLNEYVRSVWPAVKTVTATSNGFYFFQFKTEIAMEEVIEGGPWLFQGQPIVLQRWEPGMVLRKHKHTQVPVWIRLRHLPVEFWTDDGLSTVASGVGRPLYQDTITRACTRLDFARVCVMLDISSTLPKHLIIMMPREDGTEVPCKVEVEYEWVPPKCKNCMSLGHSTSACPDARKIDKLPVSVYVQKRTVQPPVSRPDVTKGADRKPLVAREDGAAEHVEVIDKGKAVVVYNPFDVLLFANDDAGVSDRGPTSSPLPIVT
ncbi:hypothetical protein Sango_2975100 [Sesamum angolense]|uniref:DUF4283 domain-containing protein n=1 Tax=Sesamum angolense TaxID=2727404 RepID=A0AAE1T4E4_9LAMI|nr:hypothetical protein Sango_2975100 [Sesamum angolense]